MKIKDCLLGQLRATGDNIKSEFDFDHDVLPKDIPPALEQHITNQQVITWDNATGMNPLWNQSPVPNNTIYMSYGDMLVHAYSSGYSYLTENIPLLTAEEYDQKIKEDYNNVYSYLAYRFAFHWLCHTALLQSDALDYDYLFIRQTDTWYWPYIKPDTVDFYFNKFPKRMYNDSPNVPQGNTHYNTPVEDIPMVYLNGYSKPKHPEIINTQHLFYGFNRAAVKLLRGRMLDMYIKEIEYYYKLMGFRSRPMTQHPNIFYKALIKNDVTVLDLSHTNFCFIPKKRDFPCKDFSRSGRTKVKGQWILE